MENSLDFDGGNGSTFNGREQNTAHRIAKGSPKAALKRKSIKMPIIGTGFLNTKKSLGSLKHCH
jgi:hypothetical protein